MKRLVNRALAFAGIVGAAKWCFAALALWPTDALAVVGIILCLAHFICRMCVHLLDGTSPLSERPS